MWDNLDVLYSLITMVPPKLKMCLLLVLFVVTANCEITELGLNLTDSDPSSVISLGQTRHLNGKVSFPNGTIPGVRLTILPTVSKFELTIADDSFTGTIGYNLITSNTAFEEVGTAYTIKENIWYKTEFAFDFGSVTSNGTDTDASNQLSLSYDIVCVATSPAVEELDWTGMALEYNTTGGEFLWLTQIGYNVSDVIPTVLAQPVFTMNPLSYVPLWEPTPVNVTMKIPNPVANVTISAETDSTDVVVQRIGVIAAGCAYSYFNWPADKEQTLECPQRTSLQFNIGTIINRESQKSTPDFECYEIIVGLLLLALDPDSVGKRAKLTAAVDIDDETVWNVVSDVIIDDSEVPNFTADDYVVQIEDIFGYQEIVPPGAPGAVAWGMSVPTYSNLAYNLYISTTPGEGFVPALSIVAAKEHTRGSDIPCGILDWNTASLTETTPGSGISYNAILTFDAANVGGHGGNDSLVWILIVLVMHPDAIPGQTHQLDVRVNELATKSLQFQVGPAPNKTTPVNYTYKLLNNNCAVSQAGSDVYSFIVIGTQRGVVAGPMVIESPIPNPSSSGSSNFSYSTRNVVNMMKLGENLLCTNSFGKQYVDRSSWNDSPDLDLAVLTFPIMCNVQMVDDPLEDILKLMMTVTIKDLPELRGTLQKFGIGIKVGGEEIVVLQQDVVVAEPIDLGTVKAILGVRMLEDGVYLTRNSDILQWSPDNVKFHDSYVDWAPGYDENDDTRLLVTPLLARYVRLKNIGCWRNYSLILSEEEELQMRFFGDASKTDSLLASMGLALDDDNSTTIPLPTRLSTSTPQYFWVSVDLAVFGRSQQNTSFNVIVIGNGISCNSSGGQVTKVTHPASELSTHFGGKRRVCPLVTASAGPGLKQCFYECRCTDAITCKDFNLLMYFTGQNIPEPYDLAGVKVV